MIEAYLRATGQLRNYGAEDEDPVFSQYVGLDLGTVVSSVSGPKRPNDRVSVTDMKADFASCLRNKVSVWNILIIQNNRKAWNLRLIVIIFSFYVWESLSTEIGKSENLLIAKTADKLTCCIKMHLFIIFKFSIAGCGHRSAARLTWVKVLCLRLPVWSWQWKAMVNHSTLPSTTSPVGSSELAFNCRSRLSVSSL